MMISARTSEKERKDLKQFKLNKIKKYTNKKERQNIKTKQIFKKEETLKTNVL